MQNNIQIIEENLKIPTQTKIAIIASRFNVEIVESLIQGAKQGLTKYGVDNVPLYYVPGAYELPFLAKQLAPKYDGLIVLGAVIRGDTPHFDYVAGECARGLMQVSLEVNKPVIFGVLTTDTLKQAKDRSGPENNKGFDCALTLLEMLNLLHKIKS